MKLLLHIGMGKTGTTALQRALANSSDILASQNAVYLGRWLKVDAPPFNTTESYPKLARMNDSKQQALAEVFHGELVKRAEREGVQTFIVSNEGISNQTLIPFVTRLSQLMNVELIAYVRHARPWLASAFRQWALLHKSRKGRVPDFETFAPELLARYGKLRTWAETFGPTLSIRKYGAEDIVADFENVAGIRISSGARRRNAMSEDAELLLRAWFNDRFRQTVKVHVFNDNVAKLGPVFRNSLDDMMDRFLEQKSAPALIEEQQEDFDYYRQTHGIDLTSADGVANREIDRDHIRNRVLDMMIEIQMQNSLRITELERRLEACEAQSERDRA